MADKNEAWKDNVGGEVYIGGKRYSFYVDTECILCSVCENEAPKNFKISEEEDHDICYKQPENKEELEKCYMAMYGCPVDAIGIDGKK